MHQEIQNWNPGQTDPSSKCNYYSALVKGPPWHLELCPFRPFALPWVGPFVKVTDWNDVGHKMEQVCSRYNEPTQALTFRKGRDNSKDSDRLLCCGLPFRTQPQTLRPYICISILHQSPRSSAARWLCCSWDMWGDAQGIAPGKIKECGQKRQWYETKEDDIMKLDTLVISLLKNLSKYEICWNAFAWNAWVPNLDPCEPDMGYKYKLWILKTTVWSNEGPYGYMEYIEQQASAYPTYSSPASAVPQSWPWSFPWLSKLLMCWIMFNLLIHFHTLLWPVRLYTSDFWIQKFR